MTGPGLTGLVTACAGAIYLILVLLWFLRRNRDRRAARRLCTIAVEPYQLIAMAKPYPDHDIHEAAAAALLAAGLIEISPAGLITVTERGTDPAHTPRHPIEAALLECFVTADEPVALSRTTASGALRERRTAFLREQESRLPAWARRRQDSDFLVYVALLTALVLAMFYVHGFMYSGEDVPTVGLFLLSLVGAVPLWLMVSVALGYVVINLWPQRQEFIREYCAEQLPHPAIRALGADDQERLRASRRYPTTTARKAQRHLTDRST